MTTLEESLTSESVTALYDAFKAGLLKVESPENGNLHLNRPRFAEVGPSLLRYVHQRMLSTAKLDPHPPDHLFPYRASITLTDIVRSEFPEDTPREKYSGLVGEIGRLLKANRMAHIVPGPGGIWVGHHIPSDEDMKYMPSTGKRDHKVEKRIEEEADKPVSKRTDLRAIKLPSGDPESVMEFVERFVPAALKVQDENKALKDEVLELKALLAETIEAAEKLEENGKWSGTADRIKDLMS